MSKYFFIILDNLFDCQYNSPCTRKNTKKETIMFDFMFDKDNAPGFLVIAMIAILIVAVIVNYFSLLIQYGFWYVTTAYITGIILSAAIVYYVKKKS